MTTYHYYNNVLHAFPKPCAFIDLDIFEQNIQAIAAQANGKKIRIASKSIRSMSAIKTILQSSSVFQGVMCFSGKEAIYLYEQGLNDLLIAYPIMDQGVLEQICQLVKKGAMITVMVDSPNHVLQLEKVASSSDGYFRVCLDVDLSTKIGGLHFGVYRSPLRKMKDIRKMFQLLQDSDFVVLDGMMGYEAQIAGVTDKDPSQKMRSTVIRRLKNHARRAVRKKRQQIARLVKQEKIELRFINGGGTGSLQETAKDKTVSEITVGSGFYQSHLFDKYKDVDLQAAVAFAIEITRRPEKDKYTCFGGGYVASGASAKDKLPEVYLPKAAKLTVNEGVGEVQTPIIYKGSIPLQLGDSIILRHSKAGEICERFHQLFVIQNGQVIAKWNTYRGDGKCF